MLDGIDDGSMEKERSHRLQQIIVDECTTYEVKSSDLRDIGYKFRAGRIEPGRGPFLHAGSTLT